MAKQRKGAVPSKVVEAVGVATVSRNGGRALAKAIEAAMNQAILDANAEGISTEEKNSAILRERMQAARRRVVASWPKEGKVIQ